MRISITFAVVFAIGLAMPVYSQDSLEGWETMGPWDVHVDKDPITDVSRGAAAVISEGSAIGVKCDGKSPDRDMYVFFMASSFLGSGYHGNRRHLTARFDKNSPSIANWAHEGRTAALTEPHSVAQFVANLAAAESLVIRATTYDGRTVTVTFDVSGAMPALSRVYEACGATPPW